MELSKISPLQNILAPGGATSVTAGSSPSQGPSFLDMLKSSLDHVNATQASAETAAQQYQTGDKGVSLEDAMVSMQKANITFQEAVQVRNKLVSAYTDIMNMQV
jgi:flagellar hook-basal body complex protein FliE